MKKRFFPTVALIFAVVVFMLLSTGCHKPGNGEGTESSGVDVPATSGGDTTTEGLGDYTMPSDENGKLLQSFIDTAYASGSGMTSLDDTGKKLVSVGQRWNPMRWL